LRGIVCFVLVLGACSSSGRDSGGADLAHGGSLDGGMAARDLASADQSPASNDFAPSTNDFAPSANDFAPSANDLSPASSDLSSAPSDLGKPPADMTPSRPPCTHGPGFAAFRFHYSQSSGTQAILDAFGLPDNSNWEAVPVYPTSYTDTNFGGGIELGSGNWILIRYSVAGLTQINGATFSVYGRSYDVSASGSFDAWSPLYGDDFAPTDSMSVYPYAWKSIDFTGFVQVGDDPGLTGIRLYPGPSSNDLIVHTVELCIDGQ